MNRSAPEVEYYQVWETQVVIKHIYCINKVDKMKLQKDYIKTFDSLKKSEGNICKAHTLKINFHLSKK